MRGFAALLLACALALLVSSSSATASTTPWTAIGPGVSVVSDGTVNAAQLSYNVTTPCCGPETWTFQTTAAASGNVTLPYEYKGFSAFFAVTVQLTAFVIHAGSTTPTPLVNAGPENCCTTPSNGFDYTGTTTLAVSAGDTYGFTMTTNNGDSTRGYSGTLTVGPRITTTATATAPLGGTIAATANLVGAAGGHGQITYSAYTNATCAAPAVYSHSVPVNGDGTYADDGFTATAAGTYYWRTVYSGDPTAGVAGTTGTCAQAQTTVNDPGNDGWSRALPISLDGNGDGSGSGELDLSGQARWYKVDVTPGGDLSVDLSNLPANYDLAVFSDIGQAFNRLSSPTDLQTVAAEFGTDAFSPSVFSPSVFSPSVFSPSVFSPSVFSPSVFSPSVFSPSVFSPSVFSPSVFSPSVFSPDPSVYEGAQVRSLVGISANDGSAREHVFANVWNNTGSFYIRVNGRNGSYAPGGQFTVTVHENSGTCGGVQPSSDPLLSTSVPGGAQTIVLADYGRMTAGADLTAMEGKVATFAGQVGGAVVDLGQASPRVAALNAQADAHANCPYAKNLVAQAIRDVVGAYRAQSSSLKYVVIVGDDHVIPFFRYPDTAGLGPESSYAPPVLDSSASQAGLQTNSVLSQDAYGASTVLHVQGIDLPVPDLPVGRLVESPAEISGMLDAYMALPAGVAPTPHSSLVTGYDFMTSSAHSVSDDLGAGLGSGAVRDELISDQGVAPGDTGTPPGHSWTAPQLRSALLGSRHDLIFLAGHFSANNTLAADYSTTLNATELAESDVNLENSIVFSVGCHSGYTIVDGDAVPNVTQPLDWTEAFAQKQATLIAGTGYQYADTDFLAYSGRLYANFAHALRYGSGPVAVGGALVQAKARYLADMPSLRGIDVKSVLESTLYGLPMLSVNLPSGRIAPPGSTSIVGGTTPVSTNPGAALGLSTFDHVFSPALSTHTRQLVDGSGSAAGQPVATWLTGPDGVDTSPGAPTLPLASSDVSVGNGNVLRGVGFRSGTYSDTTGITPLTGAPGTELGGVHSPFVSSAFFPSRLWTVNYFGGLSGGAGTAQLMLTPVQYASDAPGSLTDVQRTFSDVGLRLFYSANTSSYGGNTPALSAPPTISRVDAGATGGAISFSVHVVGDPSAGIQQAWITYTGVNAGKWESLDLTQDAADSTLWKGTLDGLGSAQVSALRFVVQAVNGVGLVSLDDDQGALYRVGSIAPALSSGTSTRAATTLHLTSAPSAGDYGSTVSVSATLTTADGPVAGAEIAFAAAGSSAKAVTDANGVATARLPLVGLPGDYRLTAGFDGDAARVDSSDAAGLSIRTLPTTLGLSGDASVADGADTGIRATLAGASAGLAQRTVAFVLTPTAGGAAVTQVRVTDLRGRAALGPVAQLLPGRYSVQAFFGAGAPVSLPADPVYAASASGTTQLTVLRTTTIAFPPVPTHFVDRADHALPDLVTVTASSGLLVTVASSTPAVCTVSRPALAGGVTTWLLQPRSIGTCTLTASQAGDADNAPAQPVTRSFTVARLVVLAPPDGGDLRAAPGSTFKLGYDLKIPGHHPAATVSFLRGKAVFAYTCANGRIGLVTADVDDGDVSVPANNVAWKPSADRAAAAQATVTVPDVCSGGLVRLRGGVLTVGVISTTGDRLNVRWHYGPSDWSDAASVDPRD